MKAYAILDGGGVKGAALAGCLAAAKEIEFQGYGGTSAGSIVALLACVGYTGEELRKIMVEEINFTDFLDDAGTALEQLKALPDKLRKCKTRVGMVKEVWNNRKLLGQVCNDLGLYNARKLEIFLRKKITDKLTDLENKADITFHDLQDAGCPPLKVVVSDLGIREPVVYSANPKDRNGPVIDAVRASMSYPFVFCPVPMNTRYLIDGGLSSNLPIFVFEDERRATGLPVIAFDLVPSQIAVRSGSGYGMRQFCADMLATALESGDKLQREILRVIHHVRIPVPPDIDTLDFSINRTDRERLYAAGYIATDTFFKNNVPYWGQAADEIGRLQAIHAPENLVVPALRAYAREFESNTSARNVRAHIMLPTSHGTRIVVYQYGMTNDSDSDMQLAMDAGCSGRAWSTRKQQFADLVEAQTVFESTWKMTREQQNKIRPDRKAMFSVPMFDLRGSSLAAQSVRQLELLGVLSVDTDTSLQDTHWEDDYLQFASDMGKEWADIFSKILG
jgi:NTE family protein